ncbi:hypothetical protein ASE74_17495 [Pedobacter sp. Leaf216]|uniref:hypothetical protein n=1 Tax=Pedobacter sp. Leaf216 TaxID=1735684 RepID=UPI0006FF2804|nr:hypothetical protein [Pedobacter sp. Leaf216]KQM77058.1 hypothetical protein ASE74_17495 [Pedobacter sp. Leaf216]
MLVHFGKTEKLLNFYEDELASCDNCNEKTVTYRIIQKYYQINGIPILPAEKYTAMSCDSCNFSNNNVISENAKVYEKLSKTPLYLYTGAAILTGTFLFLIIGAIYTAIIK